MSKYWEHLDKISKCPYCGKPNGEHDEKEIIECINKWAEQQGRNRPHVEDDTETHTKRHESDENNLS